MPFELRIKLELYREYKRNYPTLNKQQLFTLISQYCNDGEQVINDNKYNKEYVLAG